MVKHFIVEADGASRGNPGPAAYGTVVRDAETGAVVAQRAGHIGTATNNVAEYHGLIAGLAAVRELDPAATVEARLDSKLVVEQMSGRWQIKHPSMRPLALQARNALPPSQVSYVWVPRERNKDADRLANEALDLAAKGQEWAATPPGGSAEVDEAEVEPAVAVPNRLVGWDAELGVPTTTLLLRHGETSHTVEKRFSGLGGADPGLTAEGERQAKAVAERLARTGGVDAVVCSPLRRTRETAAVVAEALGASVREVDGFAECGFGEWDGLTFDEVRSGWADGLASWLADPSAQAPGGESYQDVRRRVLRARDQVLARHPGKTVLVVTHVTPIKVLVADALGAPISALYRMELSPATLSEIQWYAGGHAALRRFNDAAHLL